LAPRRCLDAHRELDLFGRVQQRDLADLLQVVLDRVGGGACDGARIDRYFVFVIDKRQDKSALGQLFVGLLFLVFVFVIIVGSDLVAVDDYIFDNLDNIDLGDQGVVVDQHLVFVVDDNVAILIACWSVGDRLRTATGGGSLACCSLALRCRRLCRCNDVGDCRACGGLAAWRPRGGGSGFGLY
jgi:hypothetical protein